MLFDVLANPRKDIGCAFQHPPAKDDHLGIVGVYQRDRKSRPDFNAMIQYLSRHTIPAVGVKKQAPEIEPGGADQSTLCEAGPFVADVWQRPCRRFRFRASHAAASTAPSVHDHWQMSADHARSSAVAAQ